MTRCTVSGEEPTNAADAPTPTDATRPDGQKADGAAKQIAVGLGNAVGQVTGTNYVPGPSGY